MAADCENTRVSAVVDTVSVDLPAEGLIFDWFFDWFFSWFFCSGRHQESVIRLLSGGSYGHSVSYSLSPIIMLSSDFSVNSCWVSISI